MKTKLCAGLALLAILLGGVRPADAQWQSQTFLVQPGWTAVYFYVDASNPDILPATPGLPIAPSNPIDQIWLWKTPVSAAQYITAPESPLAGGGQWLSWGRTNAQNTLTTLIPNAAYLIHSSAATNYTWLVKGRPVPPSYAWDMTGLNLIGFPTPAVNPPNFQNYFAQDPAIADLVQIFEYVGGPFSTNPANPVQVFSQSATPVTRGQAYWVSATNVYNSYFGPFNLNLPNSSGIDYGDSAGQFTFHLVNTTTTTLTVSMAVLPSETPPFGQTNIVAAPPLLLEGALNSSNLTYAYTSLPANSAPSASWTLAPAGQSGSDVAVVLGVNRFAMTGGTGSLYAGILQFTDSLGFSQVNVPVSATAANNAGLWLGNASVTGVSYDLKTYATNADGSLVISAVTNQLLVTNAVAPGAVTNLAINNFATTNQTIDYYQVTNELISTFTQEAYQPATNGYVLTTNQTINSSIFYNTVIDTEVTGYYFTNNGALLVWVTVNTTNGPSVLSSLASTNQVTVTNSIPPVPTNGTPVTVTNWTVFNYAITNQTVTNDIFMAPVTNQVVNLYSDTNQVSATNAAYDVVGTNLVVTGSSTSTNWLFLTNLPPGGVTLLTNVTNGSSVLNPAGTPPLVPGGTYYLGVQNTNAGPVNFALAVNFHQTGNPLPARSRSGVAATNGGYALTWFAPSNNLFQVQWSGSLLGTWQPFANPAYVSFNPGYPANATNAQFTFFDDGSQTGGSLPSTRFYRPMLPAGVSNLFSTLPQTNSVVPGGIAYYVVNVPATADFATNTLLFAGAPVNLLFSATVPVGMNASNFYGSSGNRNDLAYSVSNSPVVNLFSTTNYYPAPKPLLVHHQRRQFDHRRPWR